MSNSASELAYTVVGATTGQIIPALPGAVPADAPAYVDGSTISFSGVEIAINGTPQVGDDFQVVPSGGETLFYVCSDDKKEKQHFETFIKNKGCSIIQINLENLPSFTSTYIDLAMLSRSKLIVQSIAFSNFSFVASRIGDNVPIINVMPGVWFYRQVKTEPNVYTWEKYKDFLGKMVLEK